MRKCPYCGYDNEDDANVCQHCYAGLPDGNSKEVEKENEPEQDRHSALRKRTRS